MFDAIVGQFLQSGTGADLLQQLKSKGLTPDKATEVVQATAEGATEQLSGGGIGGLLGGLGGLGGLAAQALGGGSGGPDLASLVGPVASFVAQKTGIKPELAASVVSMVLPKLMELVKGGGASAGKSESGGGLGGLLGGLLK